VAAPRAENPVLRFNLPENGDDGFFIPKIEMNGSADPARIKFAGDIRFKIN
jgi:hypothetical protein